MALGQRLTIYHRRIYGGIPDRWLADGSGSQPILSGAGERAQLVVLGRLPPRLPSRSWVHEKSIMNDASHGDHIPLDPCAGVHP